MQNIMEEHTISPKIDSVSWGEVKANGTTYKDAKLYPGGARRWDWNETGTRHRPGIQPADVQELIEHGAKIIVLSKGMNKRLRVADETKRFLTQHDCSYYILQTQKAVERYNALCATEPVGALIHSTC